MTPFSIKPFPDPLILVYYLRFRNSWIQFLSFIFRNLSFFIYQNSSSSSIPLPVLDLIKSLEFKYCHPNEERGLFDNGLRNWGYQLFTIDPSAVNTGHVGRPGQALVDLSECIFKLTIKRIATIIDKSGVLLSISNETVGHSFAELYFPTWCIQTLTIAKWPCNNETFFTHWFASLRPRHRRNYRNIYIFSRF